jgi:hypothetical protein
MRACISIIVILGSALPLFAAEAAKPKSPAATRVAQIAPDGFPLQFPQLPEAGPVLPAPQPPVAEELPVPGSPAPLVIPAPKGIPVLPPRYMTHREFAATFRPYPGNYEVTLIHPYTRRPVLVRFSLPPGRIKEVDADPSELRFDYGSWELEVHFKRDGRVTLDIDD